MRQPVEGGHTRTLLWRLEQLGRLETLLDGAESRLLEALALDLGKPPVEAYFELVGVREELKFTRRHLKPLDGEPALQPSPLELARQRQGVGDR